MLGFLPLIVAVVGSYAWKPILLYRGLLPASAGLALLMGWALTRSKHQAMITFALVAPVIVSALFSHYFYNPKAANIDVDRIVIKMRSEWQPGDIVYHIDSGSMVGWWLYGRDLPQYKAPPACGSETLGGLSPTTRQGLGIIEKELSEIEFSRAWIVYAIGPTAQPCMIEKYSYLAYGEAWEISEDSMYVLSGVWLYEP